MSKKTLPTDVWFFVGHSIGVTLLGIHTLEAAYFGLPADQRGRLFIVVNGDNRRLYDDLLTQYPHITLVTVSKKSLGTIASIVWNGFGRRQIVLHPLSFGSVNLIHAWMTRIITLLNPQSRSIIFGEHTWRNGFFFTTILKRNLEQSIFTSQEEAIQSTGITPRAHTPQLLFAHGEPIVQLHQQSYILVHPFAASISRSLPPARWQELINWLRSTYPHYSVVISGGPADRAAALALIPKNHTEVYFSQDICRSFLDSFSLSARAALFVGVDTGPTHIAAHVGALTIVVGNNSNPCWLPYYNPTVTVLMNLSVCTCQGDKTGNCFEYEDGVKYYRCMYRIPQEEIKEAISKKLS
ncbi:MAG: glycosyltransferase family 9 protein [Patescibacteria group bacterium]